MAETISQWLHRPEREVDQLPASEREAVLRAIYLLNAKAAAGEPEAAYWQQLLLSRIYRILTQLPDGPVAEGSILIAEITRRLEAQIIASEDRMIPDRIYAEAPVEPRKYLSWLKGLAKDHRVYKHPYYVDFIRNSATAKDLRRYAIQESVVDGRFDDLLAMMQVGTSGAAKMEIAGNYWDEMGNGNEHEVHTHLFNLIYEALDITDAEAEAELTAMDLLSGNLAVLVSRYRHLYGEAVGFLGMTEWLVPDRFTNVVSAWERLGLPDVGITYHRLHITVDSRHAAGWFHNVVLPAASDAAMRRAIARGALWRLNSSARHLDERLDRAVVA
ncbi:iron-containing redox enzyme family protein [Nocardia sp. CDC159]|uniref:Iron-containing redox enzyme family protein n=1 Tax=Nocardia pulmonis TaxID=2951408 RepID=A0A9X2J247_9NOCA|nr:MULTISPECIES: iron-containing redox enzyme family protein [Nocardia]MCM6778780.1 iron-containing redox enzyme family protein [Nocardia pulmonis]MCM6791669.1 iron-containing redox enzyme family protein [Nocardia sp. CDC159]